MAHFVAVRSAIRASRATPTASRAARCSTSAGLSAADLARAARSSWAFFAFAAAFRRSAKLVFLGPFISILYAQGGSCCLPKFRDIYTLVGAAMQISGIRLSDKTSRLHP